MGPPVACGQECSPFSGRRLKEHAGRGYLRPKGSPRALTLQLSIILYLTA